MQAAIPAAHGSPSTNRKSDGFLASTNGFLASFRAFYIATNNDLAAHTTRSFSFIYQ